MLRTARARLAAAILAFAAVGCADNANTTGLTGPARAPETSGVAGAAPTREAPAPETPLAATPAEASVLPISIRYLGDPAPAIRAAMERVVARWQSVIAAGGPPAVVDMPADACFPGSPAIAETVAGLVLYVRAVDVDGPYDVLAKAGPCAVRLGGRGLPVVASVAFDTADVAWMAASEERLYAAALHETGHALGIGTLWGVQQPLLAAGLRTDDPHFTGTAARAAFDALGGPRLATGGVPIENAAERGADGHWRLSTFGSELMVGVLRDGAAMPLSAVTVGALADMGYQVRAAAADPYRLPDAVAAALRPSISASHAGLALADVVEGPRFRVDGATGRATPLAPGAGGSPRR
jgi:hypothetical protein